MTGLEQPRWQGTRTSYPREDGVSDQITCCGPGSSRAAEHERMAVTAAAAVIEHDDAAISSGAFAMGDHHDEGYPDDGETPVHDVDLDGFRIDRTAVTVGAFTAFAEDTGYVTHAERVGSSAVFHLAVRAARRDVLGSSPQAPWWLEVAGADWRHPQGPLSDVDGAEDHPVVHVSWHDARAYCTWARRRLPTEAQWEYAARGGLRGARYPWGDELTPGGIWLCNIWQGRFPVHNTGEDGWLATAPVLTYPANGFGLHEMTGNVWEWCADWFSPTTYSHSPRRAPSGPEVGDRRVVRGGSYLCHRSYCYRYRVSARSANTPDSTSSNCSFRTVVDATEANGA